MKALNIFERRSSKRMRVQLEQGSEDELTVILHRSAVHAAPQPWFITKGWRPASVTVAVTVAVTHLHTKQAQVNSILLV